MRKARTARRRPSLATAISLVALVIAMSGSAYAATGGTFILGKANKASSVTSLSNSNGTALALSSSHGQPPLTVNSSVQVPKLNASELGGVHATELLRGHVYHGVLTDGGAGGFIDIPMPGIPGTLQYTCEQGLSGIPQGQFTVTANQNGILVGNLNNNGGQFWELGSGNVVGLGSTTSDANPFTAQMQAIYGTVAVTATLSFTVTDSAGTCAYAATVVSPA